MTLPSAYLGNIEYFFHLWKNDKVVIDLFEPFQKQTYRSRCDIIGANGVQTLSVPVVRPKGKESLMHEVLISYDENWRKDHLKAIESAYSRSPYYEYYIDKIKLIIKGEHEYLHQLNAILTSFLVEKIGLTVELTAQDDQIPISENDMRINFTSKKERGFETKRYIQTFEERHGFAGNLSILDLLFNEGPNSISILQESSYSSL